MDVPSADPRAFAIEAHGTQTYGKLPYVVHLDEVASILPSDPALRAVAYLHDVLEDTAVTFEMLAQRFGSTIAEAVELVTDPEGESVAIYISPDKSPKYNRERQLVKRLLKSFKQFGFH